MLARESEAHVLVERTCFRTLLLVMILVASAHSAHAQEITQYSIPTAGGSPHSVVTGSDGKVWFTEFAGNKIGYWSAGNIVEFSVPGGPLVVALGADDNIWFTEFFGAKIGRITPAGDVTEFPVAEHLNPQGIAAGPDGHLWFTLYGSSAIGRISTSGAITVFPIPSIAPRYIASGPDGALWFTDVASHRIGRITTAGSYMMFPVSAGSLPLDLAAGPDGAIWFTEVDGNKIGRMTTSGAFTEFAIPTTAARPRSIAAGPDGALWFTEIGAGQIGRITVSGAITESPVPGANLLLTGIARGPDNAMWFAAAGADKIGRITTPEMPAALVSSNLPASRSVTVGAAATAFATVINVSSVGATDCSLSIGTAVPAALTYQETVPSTNAPAGSPNAPFNIAPNAFRSFVFAVTPSAPFEPSDVAITARCANSAAAPLVTGLNTLLISATASPVPDIVALVSTTTNDGILSIAGATGSRAFAVATVNAGSDGSPIVVAADTGVSTLPVTLTVCQTHPFTGQCTSPPASSVSTAIAPNATPTFGIFATANGAIAFDPANHRIFVRFRDGSGAVRGATSVAVRTE